MAVNGRCQVGGHAFLSYVSEDSAQVDRLEGVLLGAGIPVWRDRSALWPGEDWRERIREAITDNALAFVAFFSSNSLARVRSYQNEELVLAVEQLRLRRPGQPWLIPVRLDDCELPDLEIGGDRRLSDLQWVDVFGDGFEEGATRLVAAIQRILGPPDARNIHAVSQDRDGDVRLASQEASPGQDRPGLLTGEPVPESSFRNRAFTGSWLLHLGRIRGIAADEHG
jgi:hypothetical protein